MIPGGVNPMLLSAGGGGYQVQRSLRLRASASGFIRRAPSVTGSRRRFAIRSLVKRGALGSQMMLFQATVDGSNFTRLFFDSSNRLQLLDYHPGGAGGVNIDVISTAVFRDPTAWLDILLTYDLANASSAERWKIWVNDVQLTSFTVGVVPAQNSLAGGWNLAGVNHDVGSRGGTDNFDGCISGLHCLDDVAPTPSAFGEVGPSGNWQPKAYSGTYGANGTAPDFSDATSLTTLMLDRSGNGNNWTASNISLTAGVTYDSTIDVPLGSGGNERGNYATLNPITQNSPGGIKDGNLRISVASANKYAISTIPMKTGKLVAEMTVNSAGSECSFGIANGPAGAGTQYVGADTNSWGYYLTGDKYTGGSASLYGAAYTTGDVIRLEFNADNGQMTFFKNGVSQGVAFTLPTGVDYYFAMYGRASATSNDVSINFGQRPWAGTPTAGFQALHTGNLTNTTPITSGSFTGNVSADGPPIWCNGTPETLTINGNAVTWGTHADKTAGGFKLRTASSSYNSSGTNNWTATYLSPSSKSAFKYQLAKANP